MFKQLILEADLVQLSIRVVQFGLTFWTEVNNSVPTCLVYIVVICFVEAAFYLNNSEDLI